MGALFFIPHGGLWSAYGFSRSDRVFLRPLSKLHGHYMELFSHLETGFDKYAVS